MWDEPYLETCCRSALHRLSQVGASGRPEGLVDQPCLERLARLGFAARDASSGRYAATTEGVARHASEVLKRRGTTAVAPADVGATATVAPAVVAAGDRR